MVLEPLIVENPVETPIYWLLEPLICWLLQPHLGKQPIARWYFPPEVDYRLSVLPPDAKGLVLWVIEAKVGILFLIRNPKFSIWNPNFGLSSELGTFQGGVAVPGSAANIATKD